MSNKLVKETDKDREEAEYKKAERRSLINIMLLIVIAVAIATIFSPIWKNIKEKKEEKEIEHLIDWDSTEASPSEAIKGEGKEVVEGVISFDNYFQVRQTDARDSVSKISGLLDTKVYENLLDGIDSQYFVDSIGYDYIKLSDEVDALLTEATYINGLYDAYKKEEGVPDINYCIGMDEGVKCDLYEYITKYTEGQLKNFLLETHHKWECLVEKEVIDTELEDSYLNLFYQDHICNDYSYIDDIKLDVITVTNDEYIQGADYLNSNKNKLFKKELTKLEMGYINQLPLYSDIDFYDGKFKDLAKDTISSLFAKEVIGDDLKYIGKDVNEASLSEAIKNIEKPIEEDTKDDKENLNNWVVKQFSLTGYSPDDYLYILFKIKDITHTEKIPTLDSIRDEVSLKAKSYIAQNNISDIIYGEIDGSDEEELEKIKNGYDVHTGNNLLNKYMDVN